MEQTIQSGDTASQLALRVALQTMKERCIALQKRLNLVEEENQQLRERFGNDTAPTDSTPSTGGGPSGGAAENFQLRLQLGDLQRQKAQLSEHINMVSNENRKLWSRLSQMAKDQSKPCCGRRENDCILANEEEHESAVPSPRYAGAGAGANQNLIRSKTFTQHSPNPHLRHKLISSDVVGGEVSADISLEEVALDAYHHEAGSDVTPYGEAPGAGLGFGYMNVIEDANDTDFSAEAKRCIESLQQMRCEAMKQQQELTKVVGAVESKIASKPCPDCAKKIQKPEMADKSLETDESLTEIKFGGSNKPHGQRQVQQPLQNGHNNMQSTVATAGATHLNLLQEKIAADEIDKTCPMCGRIYNSLVTFDAFRQHVEMHFIDDSLYDVDKSFELVAHTVGQI